MMTEMICGYTGDREQAIVSYVYGEAGDAEWNERAAFEAHLVTCDRCRTELAAVEDVRVALAQWTPPTLRSLDQSRFGAVGAPAPPAAPPGRQSWRDIPVWAQTAAALLCLGAAAGVANLDVQYGAGGLRVRTGWSSTLSVPVAESRPAPAAAAAPWRQDLTALEQRLRADLGQASQANATSPIAGTAPAGSDVDAASAGVIRRVRALVEESERRQQRELALRLGEVMRDVNAQRQADLVRIDHNIGAMQNTTGREMLRQRSEMLNYVTVRTAAQRGQ
jgi:anti-sigma factor RsiW